MIDLEIATVTKGRMMRTIVRPRRLRPGARIALVAPAGPLAPEAVERGCERVRELGWEPVLGAHARFRLGYLAGSDEDRLADLMAALTPGANEGIWCLRGGYGTMRIVSSLDLSGLRRNPRPLIGFSDNTVLHLAALRSGVSTFHGPHAGVADFPDFTRELLREVLENPTAIGALPFPRYGVEAPSQIVPGVAEGPLVGGNLSLLAATMGTPYQVDARDCILFMEEVGESAYRLDRLLTQLELGGIFENVRGIAIGAFSECPSEAPGAPGPIDVVRDRLARLRVPVVYGLPFGHVPENWTLPMGVNARLDPELGLSLLEAGVEE